MRRILRKYKWLHYFGIHNADCMRQVFTEKDKWLCLITGKIFKYKK